LYEREAEGGEEEELLSKREKGEFRDCGDVEEREAGEAEEEGAEAVEEGEEPSSMMMSGRGRSVSSSALKRYWNNSALDMSSTLASGMSVE